MPFPVYAYTVAYCHYLQGTRTTRSWVSGHPVVLSKHASKPLEVRKKSIHENLLKTIYWYFISSSATLLFYPFAYLVITRKGPPQKRQRSLVKMLAWRPKCFLFVSKLGTVADCKKVSNLKIFYVVHEGVALVYLVKESGSNAPTYQDV